MSMTESILKALMRLFAIVSQIHPEGKLLQVRAIVESYLRQLVNPNKITQYLIMFDFYQSSLREREVKTGEKQISLFSVKAIIICEHINKILDKQQKLLILMQLLEILNIKEDVPEEDIDFTKTISMAFKFESHIFNSCKSFILDTLYDVPNKEDVLVMDSSNEPGYAGIRHVKRDYLKGKIIFLFVPSAHIYLFRNIEADDKLYYKGGPIIPYRTYNLEKGATLRNPLIGTIYYSDIVKEFLITKIVFKVNLFVDRAEFKFINSDNGIHSFSLYEESGVLLGILGGSGVGKSTLLNLLNGNLKPRSGQVLINGYDVHREKDKLRGIIGYIPQDDLLIEELTVFQNLYYNAKLCFRNASEDEIIQKVHKILVDLDLYEIKNLKVGNPLNKFISGGQRKRLNIALELIREPYVLLVDEPTSGLSSSDSDIVIDLLKEQSLKGKLVIINIHQPSSKIYKQFDKLLVMDKGGRVVYHGNPLDALVYFKSENQLINADDGECPTCGNLSPEQLLQILEARKVNEYGDHTSDRQVSEDDWYLYFKKNIESKMNQISVIKSDLPDNDFQIPGRNKQFKIFGIRNLLSKISDKQYLLINLFEAPLLALVLGWFTKYNAGTDESSDAYIFSENINLPVYLFMSVIVAIFLGLMVSAEEIIRDRKILQREAFLNLSRFSYYNSKIVFLVGLSAIQSAMFVAVGNFILQIEGMFLYCFLILFASSVSATLIGLNISASMKSVVAIYILIPLLLVPQILLGGAMIRFDKLNSKLTNPKYVPIVGDLMLSRWGYEALAVNQFKKNKYQNIFFSNERDASEASYTINYLLPELTLKLDNIERNIKSNTQLTKTITELNILRNEIKTLSIVMKDQDISFIHQLYIDDFNLAVANSVRSFINYAKRHYSKVLDESIEEKDALLYRMQSELGGQEALLSLKQKYQNNQLEEILLNKHETSKIAEVGNYLIRKDEPIYKTTDMKYGRAHFFAPEKRMFNLLIDTFWFNLFVILLMSLFFYLMLLTESLNKVIELIHTYRVSVLYNELKKYLIKIIKPIIKNN